MTSWCIF